MEFNGLKKVLSFRDELTNLNFRIELRGRLTIILGNSASGKTLFIKVLNKYLRSIKNNNDLAESDLKNVYIFGDNDSLESLKSLNNKIIIIDRADMIFSIAHNLIDYIKYDYNNYYVLICRGNYDLGATPNNFATLEKKDGVVYTSYAFNEKGW